MAHQFPFELDTFQKEAVLHLDQEESLINKCLCRHVVDI